jgi:hypothetical protein
LRRLCMLSMTLKCNTQRIRSLDTLVFLKRVQFDSDYYDGGGASPYQFLVSASLVGQVVRT